MHGDLTTERKIFTSFFYENCVKIHSDLGKSQKVYGLFDPQSLHLPEIEYISPSRYEQLLEQALEGDAEAQFLVGRSILEGWPATKNPAQAFLWLNNASAQDHPRAKICLAALYIQGIGVEQNYPKGLEYMRQAAESEDAQAALNLATLYCL